MTRSRLINRKQRNQGESATTTPPIASLSDERLTRRLAEMVTALSECEPTVATDAVRAILATGSDLDALEVVAMALIAVESRQRGRLRVPGYLRPDESGSLSARRAARRADAEARAAADAGIGPEFDEPAPEPDGVVLDLRAEATHVRLDLTGEA
jgi:hypothetical protein